jgi:hypothetical protein
MTQTKVGTTACAHSMAIRMRAIETRQLDRTFTKTSPKRLSGVAKCVQPFIVKSQCSMRNM